MTLTGAFRRSWLNLPLRRKGLIVTMLPVVALISFSVAFLVVQRQYQNAGRWVRHGLEVYSSLQRVRSLVLEGDDAIKSYALTGDSTYQTRYEAAGKRLQESLVQLGPVVNGRSEELTHLNNLKSLTDKLHAATEGQVAAIRGALPDGGRAAIQPWLEKNRTAMAAIDVELGAMQKLDRTFLAQRTVELSRALKAATVMGGASIVIGLIGGVIAMLLFATGVVRRIQRLHAGASGLAEGRMPVSEAAASDEIGKLTAALHSTANLLNQRSHDLERRAEELADSQAAYQQQLRLLQCILDSMSDGVTVADQNGTLILFNPAAERLFGSDVMGAQNENWSKSDKIFRGDGTTPCSTDDLPLMRAIRGESCHSVELVVRGSQDSSRTWINVAASPLREEHGLVQGGVAVIRDITLLKQTEENLRIAREEAEQANQAKNEFLSRMSHELRTPLNAVLGFAQLLEIDPLSAPQRQSVDQILKGGRHLLGLINEVLDLARIEAGRLTFSTEPIAVYEAVRAAVELVSPLAVQSRVRLNLEPPTNWRHHILADRQRFQQVLLNLLSNAIKYNMLGGTVTISGYAEADGRFHLAVRDTGEGLAPEKLPNLFKPFERLGADQSGIEGTGIGLALSKRLVEAMDGRIGVLSEPGRGSTFWIELPQCTGPLESYDQLLAEAPEDLRLESAGKCATILYIEDNLSNNLLMERILENRPDVKLISAMQGRLGLELARQHSPDLIFLDLHLPDMPGSDVLRSLRSHPSSVHTPVAMITADATQGQMDRLLAAGAQEYFTKPLDVKRLLQYIDSTLGVHV